ncbi:MAG: hypothetical protein J7M18_07055, partial [Candidatus Eremiobacteraeota bacterium]|nr:hypothetical protein [Candidatus Eremiobacteraeota bacterium]
MKKISAGIIFLLFLLIFTAVIYGEDIEIKVSLMGSANPSISRFTGFKAVIPADTASRIMPGTIRLTINGEERTFCLEQVIDQKSGNLMLSFLPSLPLPAGKVIERLSG